MWAADMNGDGHLDLLGLACNTGFLAWYENDGGDPITWSRHPVDGTYAAPITVRAGDINGDGALDVLGTSYTWGTFTWWEVTEFVSEGELVSSILDTQQDPAQAAISWESVEPTGTSLALQVRCSDNPEAMGDWSTDIFEPGQFPCTPARYVQYRLRLATEDADWSPILRRVDLSWQTQSDVGEIEWSSGLRLYLPNPVVREGALLLTLPRQAHVDVCLYDAVTRCGTSRVCEVDITGRKAEDVVEEIVQILGGKKKCRVGLVDWLGRLELEGKIDEYLEGF